MPVAQDRQCPLWICALVGAVAQGEQDAGHDGHEVGGVDVAAYRAAVMSAGEEITDLAAKAGGGRGDRCLHLDVGSCDCVDEVCFGCGVADETIDDREQGGSGVVGAAQGSCLIQKRPKALL